MRLLHLFVALVALLGFGVGPPAGAGTTRSNDQIILVYLKLSDDKFGASGETSKLYDVEDSLEAALAGTGDLDGHEVGGGYFTIYIYGPDARAVLKAIASTLKNPLVRQGSYVQFGPEDRPEKRQKMRLPLPATF